jgi:hypothetical protein
MLLYMYSDCLVPLVSLFIKKRNFHQILTVSRYYPVLIQRNATHTPFITSHKVCLPDMDCFLCCVFSVLYCSVTLYCSLLLFYFCVLYCSLFLYCTVSACDVRAATVTGIFFSAFSSVVRQMPKYNSQRRDR